MKKILIFSTAYLPLIGGAEVAVKEITDRLGDDFSFDLICAKIRRGLANYERVGSVNVYRIGPGWGWADKFLLPFLGYFKTLALFKKNDYSLFWSMMASQASILASFLKMRQPRIKLLLTLQEGDDEEHLARYVLGSQFFYKILIRPWHMLVFKKADYFQVISQALKIRAEKAGVKYPIEIVPNGVDIEKFSVISPQFSKEKLKAELGIRTDEKIIITASRLVKKNAIGDVIKALGYLSENIKFLILGDGQEKDKLASLAKNLHLSDRIIFFGLYNNDDLPRYLAISDVFVRPSLSEGQGISFLEAMAAGVPIIGTNVGGIPDFLRDGEIGLFCEVRNPKSIAEKINLLLSDDALRQKIIANARRLMEEKYDWDKISGQMREIMNRLAI